MGYIGTKPANAALTSADIEDGIITAPKIAADAVETAKVKDLNISTGKLAADAVTNAKTEFTPGLTIKGDGASADGKLTLNCSQNSHGVSIAGPPHSAAQSYTLTLPQSITNNYYLKTDGSGNLSFAAVETYADDVPTFTSVTPSTITNDATTLTIAGTNFGASGIPMVEFQNSTGAITPADSIVRDSATQLTVVATLPTDGTYFIRIELNNGLAVRTASAELTVSDAPAWTTSAGSLGTVAGDFSGTVATVAATGDTVTYSETTSVLTNASQANCSLNSSTGVITTSDFGGSSTTATTYNFTIRATDAQAQTADRAFSLTSSFELEGACLFT